MNTTKLHRKLNKKLIFISIVLSTFCISVQARHRWAGMGLHGHLEAITRWVNM